MSVKDAQREGVVEVASLKQTPVFIWSDKYAALKVDSCINRNRANVVFDMINGYDLFTHYRIVEAPLATVKQLCQYHSEEYIRILQEADKGNIDDDELDDYGLVDDCPAFKGMFQVAQLEAGGSIAAASELTEGRTDIAVWWGGGRHHAKRDEASGFCIVQDIALAIMQLLDKFPKVLYVDLDVHHGDGVQEAFALSKQVVTLSFHQYGVGFFPGSGNLEDIGLGSAQGYAVNVPVKPGLSDGTFQPLFHSIFDAVIKQYQPQALVIQCGMDALGSDPVGDCNLTVQSYEHAIQLCKNLHLPMLVLGGGGYSDASVARGWTAITALLADQKLCDTIPSSIAHIKLFGPNYSLYQRANVQADMNDAEYIQKLEAAILDNIRTYIHDDDEEESNDENTHDDAVQEEEEEGEEEDGCKKRKYDSLTAEH